MGQGKAEAMEAALGGVETALTRARAGHPAPASFDALWLQTEVERWVVMPEKVKKVSNLGQLHIAVHWDQQFTSWAYPRAAVPDLDSLFALYWQSSRSSGADYHLASRGHWLFRDSPEQRRETWAAFVANQRSTEIEGLLYVDIADVMRDTCCHWSGHWQFDGVVLDKYLGDEIDFGHYLSRHFYSAKVAERFEQFRLQLQSNGLNRDTTWSLFSPSGDRLWRLAHVFHFDGNTESVLLESETHFLELQAAGS